MNAWRWLLLLALVLQCSACSWQLRGNNTTELAVASELQHDGRISPELRQLFERTFGQNPASANYRVVLTGESQQQRIQSLTARLHTGIIRLEKELTYRIEDSSGERVETGQASAWRDLDSEEDNPASTEREKVVLTGELNRDLQAQILRHLERFADADLP